MIYKTWRVSNCGSLFLIQEACHADPNTIRFVQQRVRSPAVVEAESSKGDKQEQSEDDEGHHSFEPCNATTLISIFSQQIFSSSWKISNWKWYIIFETNFLFCITVKCCICNYRLRCWKRDSWRVTHNCLSISISWVMGIIRLLDTCIYWNSIACI